MKTELTREQILAMQPGRELDALVEEWVLGRKREVWSPSTDIADAWLVVEKLIETTPHGDVQVEHEEGEWCASLGNVGWATRGPCAIGKTAPEAICKAALLATL